MIPGIKVDKGGKPLPGAPGEQVTEGLDGLRERLAEYAGMGARFTKWRGIYAIGDGAPSRYCMEANAHALARFAALSQEAGLVPIVEPEVLMDGDHSIDDCFEATEATLREVYYQLGHHRVAPEGTLLKPNMVLFRQGRARQGRPGGGRREDGGLPQRGRCRRRCRAWSSSPEGRATDEATANLDAINRHASSVGAPWELSFSFGRGLQAAPLKAWGGDAANGEATQLAFHHRAHVASAARRGEYTPDMEG